MTIFYSWQSDVKKHKRLIEECIKKAIKNLKKEGTLLILDRDTLGKVGTVNILNTLIDKIKQSQIFIADLTIINSDYSGRKTPNPNVLYETGFATGYLGEEFVICLFDEEFGKAENDFPFDIKSNRMVKFSASDKSGLTKNLTNIFRATIKELENRDKTQKVRRSEDLKNELTRVIEFLRLFSRRVFNADFDQEHPVKMYESINDIRLTIQQRGLIYDISDFEIKKCAEDILEILNNIISRINSSFPKIEELSQELEQLSGFQIREKGLLTQEEYNDAVNSMSKDREILIPKIKIIEEYHLKLKEKNGA